MKEEIIRKILDHLKEKQLVHEKDGVFEIKHDSVALVVNNMRTTEDKNRLTATQLVYETEKNRGNLNQYQLARIEPYRDKLAFKNEDKERLEAWLAHERVLAIKKVRRDRRLKNRALAAAFLCAFLGVVSVYTSVMYTRQGIRWDIREAKDHIKNENFPLAKQTIRKIGSTTKRIPSIILDAATKTDIDSLRRLLLFDLTASKVKVGSTYVTFSNSSSISALQIKDLQSNTKVPLFTKSLRSDSASNPFRVIAHGFSKSTNNFWLVEETPGETTLKVFDVGARSKLITKEVDQGEIVDADFDEKGNLYYFKNHRYNQSSIRAFSWNKELPIDVFRISEPIEKIQQLSLKFLEEPNRRTTRFLKLSMRYQGKNSQIHDLTSVWDIKTGKNKTIPFLSEIAIDSARYLIYDQNRIDSSYQICTFDFVTGRTDSQIYSRRPQKQDFFTLISPLRREINARKKILSNDKKAEIELLDSSTIQVRVNNSKDIIRLSKGSKFVTFKPYNNIFSYIYINKLNEQFLCFRAYNSNSQNSYIIPARWKFTEFLEDKFIMFEPSQNSVSDVEGLRKSLLVVNEQMFKKSMFQRIFAFFQIEFY